jgi:hypothetical protein
VTRNSDWPSLSLFPHKAQVQAPYDTSITSPRHSVAEEEASMPSFRYRRDEQCRHGNISRVPASTALPSSRTRSLPSTSGSVASKDSLRSASSASSGSVSAAVAYQAGVNTLVCDKDGSMRPGRLLSSRGRGCAPRGCAPLIIDGSESVNSAPSTPCKGLQAFVPQWRGNVHAVERYKKTLQQRYVEGSLRNVTALGRKQMLDSAILERSLNKHGRCVTYY